MEYVTKVEHFDQNRPKVLQINNWLKLMSICFLIVVKSADVPPIL